MSASSTKAEETIAGLSTHFLLSTYTNGALLVVTQVGKLGTIVEAIVDISPEGSVSSFSTRPLLCDRGEGAEALARALCEEGYAQSGLRRLVLALAIRDSDPSPEAFRAILRVVRLLWKEIVPSEKT